MKSFNKHMALIAIFMFIVIASRAQLATADEKSNSETQSQMKTYVIVRNIPGAGKLTPEELKAISQTSCGVLKEMGPRIEWLHSYVTGDQIYCIYKAQSEADVREHAAKGGFPANQVIEVATVISPATADLATAAEPKKKG